MVSIGPYTQIYDMKHMYDFHDFRNNSKIDCSYTNDSLMAIINSNPDFTIFAELVKKAKYDGKLSDKQSDFTIFIPSDIEIKKKYSIEYLNNIDDGFAREIINASMMNRKIDQNLIQSSPTSTFPTVNRSRINVNTVNGITMIQDFNKVIDWNHIAINGLIHVVDRFIIPENSTYRG